MIFGLTMLVVGMGGTLLALVIMAALLRLLTLVFPVKKAGDDPEKPER